jgi:hypothetical protein
VTGLDHITAETAQAELDYQRDKQRRQQEITERAHELHTEIVRRCAAIRTAWVELAAFLHAFMDDRGWEVLGYDSENAYFADPEVGIGPTHGRRLLRVYRALVVERAVPPGELAGVEITKLDVTLPAVKAGDVDLERAIADARALSRSDLEIRYAGDPDAPLDATTEPERRKCPCCGRLGNPANFDPSWTRAE